MWREIQFVEKTTSGPKCRIGIPLAAASLAPGPLKHGKEVDISHLHVSLAHVHTSVLKATAKQHGIRLTGELVPCSACSRAKGHRAPTSHHVTRRSTQPLGLVHIDTAGPYPTSLGRSRYVVMFVDSTLRLQRPYGVREKSAAAILSVVKRFVANMGVPRAFRTDNGTEEQYVRGLPAMASEFVASLRRCTRHSRIDPSRARYRELSRLDTRRDLEFHSCTRTSAWKRYGVVPMRQERASGWSHYSGRRSATTGRQHQ